MTKLRAPTIAALAAGVAALVLSLTAIAQSAPGDHPVGDKSARTPRAAAAPPAPPDGRIVSGAGTGTPSGALTTLSQDSFCEVDDLCLSYYRGSLGWGSWFDTPHNEPYLQNNRFITTGAGQGQAVANNAQGFWNRGATYVRVCDGANYTGACVWLPPNSFGDLPSYLSDRVESFIWYDQAN